MTQELDRNTGGKQRSRLAMAGRVSFWIQAVLGGGALISWGIVGLGQIGFGSIPAGAIIAFWTTLLTLVTLGGNIFFTYQYWQQGQNLQSSSTNGFAEARGRLQWVVYLSLIGALLALVSSAAQIGELLAGYFILNVGAGRSQVLALLLTVANTNVTLAHLVSLTSVLWINGILDRSTARR